MKKAFLLFIMSVAMPLLLQAGHKWVVTYAKGAPYAQEGYVVTERWYKLAREIDKRWKKGYDLIDVAQGYTKWVGLFAKNTGFKSQSYVTRRVWADFRNALKEKLDQGYALIDLEHGDD
ncbi:MAG TPA: hypothetical protein ENK93_02225, partial [Campylobacteraceae bacterium]|nr:hypothetical protein [Campylobacteraceae bacterium]